MPFISFQGFCRVAFPLSMLYPCQDVVLTKSDRPALQKTDRSCHTCTPFMYMLWFNFILGSNVIFLCFLFVCLFVCLFVFFCFVFFWGGTVIYNNEFKIKENKILTKDKIEPQHICLLSVTTDQNSGNFTHCFRSLLYTQESLK